MRAFVVVGCLIPFALAAEAAISRSSPEAAVAAAYRADALALQSEGSGVIGDPTARTRFFSRALLKTIDARWVADASSAQVDPISDGAPRVIDLTIAPVSESGGSATVLAEFARGDGSRERLTYAMVVERGEWRIDDINYALFNGEAHGLRDRTTE